MVSTGRAVGVLALVLWCAGTVGGGVDRPAAQPELPDPTDVLLAMPPLPLDLQTEDRNPLTDREPPPTEDAPIRELEAYWYNSMSGHDQALPEKVWRRLLEACRGRPGRLIELLSRLPATPEVVERVEKIQEDDRAIPREERLSEDEGPGSWNDRVRGWLAGRSLKSVAELEKRCRAIEGTEYGVTGSEYLAALARDRWDLAVPILEQHARSTSPTLSALALALMFKHDPSADVRQRLLAIADQKPRVVPNGVSTRVVGLPERETAIRALLAQNWPGRDAWYLKLFEDPTILGDAEHIGGTRLGETESPVDGLKLYGYDIGCPQALMGPLIREPDRMVPLVVAHLKRAGTPRDTAAWCLVLLAGLDPRTDALVPLKPWLEDPQWSRTRARWDLFEALVKRRVPELVDALLVAAQRRGTSDCECDPGCALRVLEAWKEKAALPVLAQRLEQSGAKDATPYVRAWIEIGGWDVGALAGVLIAACSDTAWPPLGRQATARVAAVLDESFREQSIKERAAWWTREKDVDPKPRLVPVTDRLLERIRSPGALPATAGQRLRSMVLRWPPPALDADLVDRLGAADLDQPAMVRLVERRHELRKRHRERLVHIARGTGWNAGLATALLADRDADARLVSSADERAQAAFVTVRRLAREPLPLDDVRTLAERPLPALRQALDRAARDACGMPVAALLAARPAAWPMYGAPLDATWQREVAKRRTATAEGVDEQLVFATRTMVYRSRTSGSEPHVSTLCIQVRKGDATLEMDLGDQHPYQVPLSRAELQDLRAFIASNGVDGLPVPTNERYGLGADYLYLHYRGGAVRALTMHYEQLGGCGTPLNRHHDVYDWLLGKFWHLEREVARGSPARTDAAGRPIEVVLPPRDGAERSLSMLEQARLESICKHGAELLVLDTDHAAHRGSWRQLVGGRLGAARPQPAECPYLGYRGWTGPERPLPGDNSWFVRHSSSTWPEPSSRPEWDGLWYQPPGREPVRVLAASGLRPVVTADGRWAVTDGEKSVVVHDLAHRTEREVPVAGRWACSVHGPTPDGRVLVRRYEPTAAWWSLDPATGRLTPEHGELEPYLDGRWRAFQPAREPGQVWVALEEGRIGLYDPVRFRFRETNHYPGVRLQTMAMWVDEDEDRVYAIEGNAVFRMPLHAKDPQR